MLTERKGRPVQRRPRMVALTLAVALVASLLALAAPAASGDPKSLSLGDNVSYGDGSPAPGVKIDLFEAESRWSRGLYLGSATTDGSGNYSFDVSQGCFITVAVAPLGAEFDFLGSRRVYDQTFGCVEGGPNNDFDSVLYVKDTTPDPTTTTIKPTTTTTKPSTTTTIKPTTTTTEPTTTTTAPTTTTEPKEPPPDPPTYCGYNPRAGILAIYGSDADSFLLFDRHGDVTPFATVFTAERSASGGPPGNRPELGDYSLWMGLPGFRTFTLHVEAQNDGSKKPSKRIPCDAGSSPIGLDVDGSGSVERVSAEVAFDFAGNGEMVTATEWFAPTEGILFDTRIEGPVTGAHLFGDQDGLYADGFEKLALLDGNGDGQVAGGELDGLAIWIDANSNGVLDAGEQSRLVDHGVMSLSTSHTNMVSTAGLADGSLMVTEDLWFPTAAGAMASNGTVRLVLLAGAGLALLASAARAGHRRREGLDRELEELTSGHGAVQ